MTLIVILIGCFVLNIHLINFGEFNMCVIFINLFKFKILHLYV